MIYIVLIVLIHETMRSDSQWFSFDMFAVDAPKMWLLTLALKLIQCFAISFLSSIFQIYHLLQLIFMYIRLIPYI